MSRDEIEDAIDEMEQKLKETKESSAKNTGPVNDALQVVIPMMEDQIVILRGILDGVVNWKDTSI